MDRELVKISVITINFNNLEGLKKTVESVIGQRYQDIEYIVIDGGSKDGSAEYIEEMSSHFRYWISESDNGIYNAMNKGIKKAQGEYLQFLNSGDHFVDHEVLEKIAPSLVNCDIIYGNCRMIMPDGRLVIDRPIEEKINLWTFIRGTINHQSTFISRRLFNKYGLYDETLKLASDWKFFFIAAGLNHCKTKYIPIDVVRYERNGISQKQHHIWQNEKKETMQKMLPVTVLDYFKERELENIRASIIEKHKITIKLYRISQILLIRLSRILDRVL